MKGQPVSAVSFKKKEEAVTMSTKPAVKIGGERVSVDPQLLFQRLLHVAGGDLSKIKEISSMNWQPCPHPCLTTAGSCENLANTYWQSTCGMPVKVANSKCWNWRCSQYPWWWLFNSPTVLAERHILQALSWEVCWVCEEIIPSCDSRLWWVFWGPFLQDVFFSSTRSSAARRWEIKRTQSCLGPNVCKNILPQLHNCMWTVPRYKLPEFYASHGWRGGGA